jgi:hypothetical protein
MFLFTTPPTRDSAPSTPVVDAIRTGADRSGVGFDYLLATAQRESALQPAARARASTAAGLFQFIEQTWLGLIKSDGARAGVPDYARAVTTRSDGTHAVDDPRLRQSILALREDPEISAVMAGALTRKNHEILSGELGRAPSGGELYMAHFLGARGASDLIRAARQTPDRAVASDFPEAAAANRSIFYDRDGRARGAGEVYALLAQSHGGPSAAPAFAPDKPLAFASSDGPAFHGLFQSDRRAGPISEAVARLWRPGRSESVVPALAFYPSSSGDRSVPREVAVEVAAPSVTAPVPLPPPRPRTMPATQSKPLDLSQFIRQSGT